MKRALLVVLALGAALVGGAVFWPRPAAAMPSPSLQQWILAARPSGEFPMMLRLNGSPTKTGTIVSAAGASTTNASTSTPFTITAGEIDMVYCDAAAVCIEGSSASTSITNAAFGRAQPATTEVFWIFKGTTAITFACAGPAAFNCAVFRMD